MEKKPSLVSNINSYREINTCMGKLNIDYVQISLCIHTVCSKTILFTYN